MLDRVDMDPYLGPFVGVPAKENGFDIEGLAVAPDGRVFLGLRGPVLRGWAVILDLSLARHGATSLAFARTPAYRRHFLDLAGLGVRDLLWHGSDLVILAGPTMDLDGPVHILRWRDALSAEADSVVGAGPRIETILEVPYGRGCDHAEGIALVDDGRLLVVYDLPCDLRLDGGKTSIVADLFDLRL
ncbi:MAG: DUF3616 domain-containing protein [Geminicoccaceae bacterium]